ncbi:MAG: hypothetical protein IJR87_00095 [Bacteroidaceae bacterium]|nr:hypothetical protein [Bacteroidaceae bacterium]
MKIKYQALITVTLLSVISCTPRDNDSHAVSKVALLFLESFYTYNFQKSAEFCTSHGTKAISWYASNLTADELSLVTSKPKIKLDETEVKDTVGIARFSADNVLVTTSLEENAHIGTATGCVLLVKRKGNWMVNGLEW